MQRRFINILSSIMAPKGSKSSKKDTKPGVKEKEVKEVKEESAINVLKSGDYSIKILAKPGSKESGIVGLTEEGLELKIGAPAVEGAANTELIEFLSKLLSVRKSDVSLDRGSKSRVKTVNISKDCKLSLDQIKEIINTNVGK
ncbi:unnamed protein product [Chironomus riparius]|uniref:Uncharacterized protein n=1 Tax=Chironomus riparius TaxID=315576 RepID=A0A9N9WQX4_9DIPT|nr:unnamed protein product [Chironomus riparius]